ncbi:MAG: YlqD family protein [Candidatus Muirbacterium halophilum]|nr:YlqD family protein [Candidatus Muirbacterium halophilum]MCK9475272.1 YlqD family protein [Candidatus Muirbacterium halophilum]
MSIKVTRKIVVKSLVTPELKEEIGKQVEDAEVNLNNNISLLNERLLDERYKHLEGQIHSEIGRLNVQLGELAKKKEEMTKLEFGQEFYQGTIDSPVDIELGDNLFEKISRAEIIVNNGEVTEFRNI